MDSKIVEALRTICERLSERSATLFLGAGINFGIKDNVGNDIPLGDALSKLLCRDLLGNPDLSIALDEAAEIARYKLGNEELNRYLYELFTRFRPGTAHLAMVQLPWDALYTTNYDLLVEGAAQSDTVHPAGSFKPVFSVTSDLSIFGENDILYYKLHGSIDHANEEEGRLILSKDDYRHYELHRKPLFRRLREDLLSRTFVFIGYSLRDDNFRGILEDCRNEIGAQTLPLSYAIRPQFTEVEETFWREKYNIQLIRSDASDFLNALKESWLAEKYQVVPIEERKAKTYLQIDQATRFGKVAESFYRIATADCSGATNARAFFHGAEPSWGDIRDHVAPRRDAYWTLLDTIFPELGDPSSKTSSYLITGAAGTGKTTLIRTLAYDIVHDFMLPVLVHIPGTPLDARHLGALVDNENPQRIVVIIHHAAEYIESIARFVADALQLNLPLTIILEERKNQWQAARNQARTKMSAPAEIEVGSLSAQEVENILDALAQWGALGKLTTATREQQTEHFLALADKELLVALRELTSDDSFDKIVRDEYEKIPSELAKEAYVYVAMLGQINLPLRYETLVRLLDLRYDQLHKDIFVPSEGILISGEVAGSSRHSAGFILRTRHPIIASIIFANAAPDDAAKFKLLNSLLTELDPGYPDDLRILTAIVRSKDIVNTFASEENRRAVYDRLAIVLPGNVYVLQHRSILERDLGNADMAVKYAQEAYSRNRSDQGLANTLGLALEMSARNMEDSPRRQAVLGQALRLFEENIRYDSTSPFGYVGQINILRQRIERESDATKATLLKAEALSILESAYETTAQSTVIAQHLANYRNQLGDPDEAIAVVKSGLEKKPADERLRGLWVKLEAQKGNFKEGLAIALEGVKYSPTSWRLQRDIARLKRKLEEPIQSVRGYYDAAIRHNKGDLDLLVELGSYLFTSRMYGEAEQVFKEAREVPAPGHLKNSIREFWKENGKPKMFSGKVRELRGGTGTLLAVPENFRAFYWRTHEAVSALRFEDAVTFTVGFNARGPIAQQIMIKSKS